MDISQVFQVLKLGSKAYAVTALTSAIILVLRAFHPNVLNIFGASEFVEKYLPIVFFVFLLCFAALFVSLISVVFNFIMETWISRMELKKRQELLHFLSAQECEFLAGYLENDISAQRSTYSDGVANGLQAKEIVFRTSQISAPGSRTFPYNIQPWALNYLTKNKDLLYKNEST